MRTVQGNATNAGDDIALLQTAWLAGLLAATSVTYAPIGPAGYTHWHIRDTAWKLMPR